MTKFPVINTRYESVQQVNRFKRAAKINRWSLNTFLLAAGEMLSNQIISDYEEKQKQLEKNQEAIKVLEKMKKRILQEDQNAEGTEGNRPTA
jgi:Zn-dependent M32 family carboxypeptidase